MSTLRDELSQSTGDLDEESGVSITPDRPGVSVTDTETGSGRSPGKADRPDIHLPNGDVLKPRDRLAAEHNISTRTLSRMGVETVLVANVAFCSERSFLRIVASGLRAPKRRRRR